MSNSLGRNIEPGELVVLSAHFVKSEFQAIEHRILVAISGFGLQQFTMGRALYARDLFDRTEYRWNGEDFDEDETNALKAELMELNLTDAGSYEIWLQSTDNALWAQDVIKAIDIWAKQAVLAQIHADAFINNQQV